MGATVGRDNSTSENDIPRSYSSNNQTGHLRALTSRSPNEHDQSTGLFPVDDVNSLTQFPTRMYSLQARMSAISDKSFKTLKEDHNSEHIAKPEEVDRDDIRTRSSILETPENDDNNDDDDDDDVGNESIEDNLPGVPHRAASSAISRLSRKVDVIFAASKSGINSVRGYRPVNALTSSSSLDVEDNFCSLQSPWPEDPLRGLAEMQPTSVNIPPLSDPIDLRPQQSVNRGKFRWTAKSNSLPEGKAQSSKYHGISFFEK